MNQILLVFLASMLSLASFGQDVYFTKTARVIFDSSTPLETIHAENNQVTSFLKIADGELNFAGLIKSFKFKNALMEEHFNENYVESAKYPKAVFKGQILNWAAIDLNKEEAQEADIQGELTLHGVSKMITVEALLLPQNGSIIASCTFVVSAEDFNIEIPTLVRDKIAKEVTVSVNANYEPYKR